MKCVTVTGVRFIQYVYFYSALLLQKKPFFSNITYPSFLEIDTLLQKRPPTRQTYNEDYEIYVCTHFPPEIFGVYMYTHLNSDHKVLLVCNC
jgi:hypothetical protein